MICCFARSENRLRRSNRGGSLRHVEGDEPCDQRGRIREVLLPALHEGERAWFRCGLARTGGAVDDDTKLAFEREQVVVVHPNQYLPETGYLACGETVLVGDGGAERLARTDTKLYVKECNHGTMQPALKNGRNVWDRVNMPESEFEGRVERVRHR